MPSPMGPNTTSSSGCTAPAATTAMSSRAPSSSVSPMVPPGSGSAPSPTSTSYGPGKPVCVRVDSLEDKAVLHVTDEGMGIPPEHQSRIFERFERAVSERHYGGLGLGLFISQQIVRAHGGRLRVESTPGVRTTFTAELPLEP
ncbi:sensor histidine kinase [Cystobacter fuscus]